MSVLPHRIGLLAAVLLGCASASPPSDAPDDFVPASTTASAPPGNAPDAAPYAAPEPEDRWKDRTSRWASSAANGATRGADAAARGATAVGRSIGTAYRGVRTGFEEPDDGTFGAYPEDYVATVRRHLVRFEGAPANASFRIHRPQRGYINRGLFRGGEIEWQGYLVDVEVQIRSFTGQRTQRAYVVRLRNGEVIEAHDHEYASALRRVETTTPAAAAAD